VVADPTSSIVLPVEFRDGSAPVRGPMPGFRRLSHSVKLDLPELGSTEVSAEAVIVSGPDQKSRNQVLGQLGTWATGQWLRANGLTAMNGSCVERGGRTVILTGAPRTGCSVLALAMMKQGWALTSDGVVGWGDDGVPVRFGDVVTVDRSVALGVESSRLSAAVSGRDRVEVRCSPTRTGRLGGVVVLSRRLALREVAIQGSEGADLLAERLATSPIPPLVNGLNQPPACVPAVPGVRVRRPISSDEAVVRRSSPPVLAGMIETAFSELT